MTIKSIAVFCGSKSGNNPLFEEHAKQLGHLLAHHNITLIYGGGNKGLMGAVANAVMEKQGKVIGIIPQLLTDREHSHQGISELTVVDNMHIRKQMLYEKCDAAVILPGGFGTLDELYEMLTWNQLSIHNKPIFILNSDGFYNALLQHNLIMQQQEFLYDKIEDRMVVIDNPNQLADHLI
jgi:uncharacterized protein (TIGR00730 family)